MIHPRLQHFPALATLARDLHAQDQVLALLWFGSSFRGEHTASSDIDLYVITRSEPSWIEGRWIDQTAFEIHFGPASFWQDLLDRRVPTVVHAFCSGGILFEEDACAFDLMTHAQALWAEGPAPLSERQLDAHRFHLGDQLDDLREAAHTPSAHMLATALVLRAIDIWFAHQRHWTLKWPKVLEYIEQHDKALSTQLFSFYDSHQPGANIEGALRIGQYVLDMMGGPLRHYTTK